MNKETAILMVRKKWAEMGVDEKEVWRGLAREEKKQKYLKKKVKEGVGKSGSGSNSPSKEVVSSNNETRATDERKLSPHFANSVPISESTVEDDERVMGLRHLMAQLVPKLMEGGVDNLELAQAMVTKKWGEMGMEEKSTWIQIARSGTIMEQEKPKSRPEVTVVFNCNACHLLYTYSLCLLIE